MKRIIDKETLLFLRDDIAWDEELEIALDVEPAQGLYIPKWAGEWIEGASQEYIDSLKPMETEPTLAEMVIQNRADLDYLLMFQE